MLQRSAHSKRASISRKAQVTVNVTSYTRATMTSGHAKTNADIREGYSSKTLKTWMAGEICQEQPAGIHIYFMYFIVISFFSSSVVKCTKHNWKLNVSTMKYVNPPDSFLQDELGKCFPGCFIFSPSHWYCMKRDQYRVICSISLITFNNIILTKVTAEILEHP